MTRKLFFIVIVLLIADTMAFAQTEADFKFGLTADNEGVLITKYTGKATVVRIPATIQGMPVREIGNEAFEGNATITSVVIPQGVTKIAGATSSVSFKRIYVDKKGNQVSTNKAVGTAIVVSGSGTFANTPKLTSITLPEGLLEIGSNAFVGTNITTIILPQSLTTLGNNVFSGSRLTSVTLPGGLKNIGRNVFFGCTNLKTATLAEGITAISNGSAHPVQSRAPNTQSQGSISLEWGTEISGFFAYCTAITTITLPSTLTAIGDYAFDRCTALKTITLPASLTTIGQEAFSGCTALTTIILPASLTTIGQEAFSGCTALTAVTFPALLTKIGQSAFAGCTALATVTLPASLTSIEQEAFKGCTALTTITFPASLTKIGGGAFSNSALTTVTIPETVGKIEFGTYMSVHAFSGCNKLTLVSQAALGKVGYTGGIEARQSTQGFRSTSN